MAGRQVSSGHGVWPFVSYPRSPPPLPEMFCFGTPLATRIIRAMGDARGVTPKKMQCLCGAGGRAVVSADVSSLAAELLWTGGRGEGVQKGGPAGEAA